MLDACCSRRDIHRFQNKSWSFITQPPVAALRKKKTLAEGLQVVVPKDSRGRRLWSKMSDDEIVEYAQKLMEERGISRRKELKMADCGLYTTLYGRRLSGEIGFEEKRRKSRTWKDMSDEEIVEFARKMMEEKGITRRSELVKADCGLYGVLKRKRLLDGVGFAEKPKRRSWKGMSDEEIIGYVREFMMERGITGRGELQDVDGALYDVLVRRELLDEIGFEAKLRSWKGMSDEEIIEFARKLMKERGIRSNKELEKADSGLYQALQKRELLDEIGFEAKLRSWKNISDGEVVEYARKLMEERGITGRAELCRTDSGLYKVLLERGLLDHTFAHIEQQRNDKARDAVIDALTKFANEKPEVGVA